jgi:hypothetical protein
MITTAGAIKAIPTMTVIEAIKLLMLFQKAEIRALIHPIIFG